MAHGAVDRLTPNPDSAGVVAVGQGAHEKHRFRSGMELSGQSVPVDEPRLETAESYKTSGLGVDKDATSHWGPDD